VFGYDVVKLERIRIMNVSLKGLPPGDWRDLTAKEVATILSLTEHSASESEGTGRRSARRQGGKVAKAGTGKPGSQKRATPRRGEGGKPATGKAAKRKVAGTAHPDRDRSDRATPASKTPKPRKSAAQPVKASRPTDPRHKIGSPPRKPRGRK
jgi:23S rRNA pseudouridine2604 synthase